MAVLVTGSIVATATFLWTGATREAPDLTPSVAVEVDVEASVPLVIHVSGAVNSPGVVQVPDGARVHDVLTAAGGPRPDAHLDALNLARHVADGELIQVPAVAAVGTEGSPSPADGARRPDGTLDLNRASASELEELPGIGPVLARRIVEHREANGPFVEKGQLREVPGIGERTFQSIADHVSV